MRFFRNLNRVRQSALVNGIFAKHPSCYQQNPAAHFVLKRLAVVTFFFGLIGTNLIQPRIVIAAEPEASAEQEITNSEAKDRNGGRTETVGSTLRPVSWRQVRNAAG